MFLLTLDCFAESSADDLQFIVLWLVQRAALRRFLVDGGRRKSVCACAIVELLLNSFQDLGAHFLGPYCFLR